MTDRNRPVRAASSDSQYSLMEFMREFPDDATCLEWLWLNRIASDAKGETAPCDHCAAVTPHKRYGTSQRRQSWTCTRCGHHVHPTAGTIFHKSSTSLHLWFYAIYLMASTRCGISAKQLERELGVTYKTAWRMFHLIRNDIMGEDIGPLGGADEQVEMDEMYVGGKPRLKDKRRNADGSFKKGPGGKEKAVVFGAVERGGRVRAQVVPKDEKGVGVQQRAREFVLPATHVFTDESSLYDLEGKRFAQHQRIQHKQAIYVNGDIHTQTIEGFWSLVKNGIRGAHHSVSAKHLQGYLNEYSWRYNHRFDEHPMFLTLLKAATQESQSLTA